MLLKKTITHLSLLGYCCAFIIEPIYANVQSTLPAPGQKMTSDAEMTPETHLQSVLNLKEMASSLQNGHSENSFQSMASNSSLPVSLSVNPATLQLQLAETITRIQSAPLSTLHFTLQVTNTKSINALNNLFPDKALALNIPYIQLRSTKKNKHYYDLMLGSNKHSFVRSIDNQGKEHIQFFYTKKEHFTLEFISPEKIKFTAEDGAIYLFERAPDKGINYLYRVRYIINNKGEKISLSYQENEINFSNNSGMIVAKISKNPGQIFIRYLDILGRWQVFKITNSTKNRVEFVNALNQTVSVLFTDNQMAGIKFPNGTDYQANYKTLDTLDYIIDGRTQAVESHDQYVYRLNKYFHNQYTPDQTYTYSISNGGNNFAGNNIRCSQKTFDQLTPFQDWMMECGFEQLNGVYGYSTKINSNIAIFSGSTLPRYSKLKLINSYNYLHLPVSISTRVDQKILSSVQYIYDRSIKDAKNYDQLSHAYHQPLISQHQFYDIYGNNSLPLTFAGTYQYFNPRDKDQPGYALGFLKSAIDGYGNQIDFQYYANEGLYGNHQTLVKSQTIHLNGYNKTTKIENTDYQWLHKTISLEDQNYTISMPYTQKMISSLAGQQTKSTEVSFVTNSSSLMYGMPVSSQENIQGEHPYLTNTLSVEPWQNDGFALSTYTAAAKTHSDATPTTISNETKYYNRFGGLIKTVHPISGDVTIYGDAKGKNGYDALGRITQITFLPAGDLEHKQTYLFDYTLNSQSGDAGYILTTTTILPSMKDKQGYQTRTYYDQESKVTKVEKENADGSGFYTSLCNYYDDLGRLKQRVQYFYDQKGVAHPQTTHYFYDAQQKIAAIQHPNGSADVSINDPYHQRQIHYKLEPTGIAIGDTSSLCFDPLQSQVNHRVYNSCKVSFVHVKEQLLEKVRIDQNSLPVWKNNQTYDYSIIMNPNFTYTDKTGKKVDLYPKEIKAKITDLNQNIDNGHAYDPNELSVLFNHVKNSCLDGACIASRFTITHTTPLKQIDSIEDKVNGFVTTNIYSIDKPEQLIAQTYLLRQDSGALRAIRTIYDDYDKYGNLHNTYTAKGAYDDNAKKILIGSKTYSALGYLLTSTSLIGSQNKEKQIRIHYDQKTGLPSTIEDALDNKMTIYYDHIWRLKPAEIEFKGVQDHFTICYQYNKNGDLSSVSKKDSSGKVISQYLYQYHSTTQQLERTTIEYFDGNTRTLHTSYNNYMTPISSTYKDKEGTKLNQLYTRNALGLVTSTQYTGNASFELGAIYNPDLSLQSSSYDKQALYSYRYDDIGRLIKVDNYLQSTPDKPARSYEYTYDRLGQKSSRISYTNQHGQTIYRYGYTPLGQLATFTCQGHECPQNLFGKSMRQINYRYDDLFNTLNTVEQTLSDNTTQKLSYAYDYADPTQVSSVDYGQGKVTRLNYDDNGNVTQMSAVNSAGNIDDYQLQYDAQQNLTKLNKNKDTIEYIYDDNGKQIATHYRNHQGQEQTLYHFYLGGLSEQITENTSRYYLPGGSVYHGAYEPTLFDGFHATGSVQGGKITGDYVYTPFGAKSDLSQAQEIALSVQKTNLGYRTINTDGLTGWQFLGNGYRAYNPELGIFMKHDSASPFGIGGLNAYSYADNDPVNAFDPSGHATKEDIRINNNKIDITVQVQRLEKINTALIIATSLLGLFSMNATIVVMILADAFSHSVSEILKLLQNGESDVRSDTDKYIIPALNDIFINLAFIGAGYLAARVVAVVLNSARTTPDIWNPKLTLNDLLPARYSSEITTQPIVASAEFKKIQPKKPLEVNNVGVYLNARLIHSQKIGVELNKVGLYANARGIHLQSDIFENSNVVHGVDIRPFSFMMNVVGVYNFGTFSSARLVNLNVNAINIVNIGMANTFRFVNVNMGLLNLGHVGMVPSSYSLFEKNMYLFDLSSAGIINRSNLYEATQESTSE